MPSTDPLQGISHSRGETHSENSSLQSVPIQLLMLTVLEMLPSAMQLSCLGSLVG